MKDIIDSLHWRYAVKKFDPSKKITTEKLEKIKEALVLSSSSFGLQPWKFIFVNDVKTRKKLRVHSWNQSQITDCSDLVVLCNLEKIDEQYLNKWLRVMAQKGTRSIESLQGYKEMVMKNVVSSASYRGENQKQYIQNQVFIALGNLMTVCASLEIDTCPIGGFDPEKYDEILGLSAKGLQSCVVCPLGYRSADDSHSSDPKIRFDQSEILEEV